MPTTTMTRDLFFFKVSSNNKNKTKNKNLGSYSYMPSVWQRNTAYLYFYFDKGRRSNSRSAVHEANVLTTEPSKSATLMSISRAVD